MYLTKKLLILNFLVFCFVSSIFSQQSSIPPNGFVYAEGSKFMLNGAPFYFSGTNVYDFFTYGAGGENSETETQFMNKARIDKHMRKLYENGIRVVRLWGFSHEKWHGFEIEKGIYDEKQFSLFDYIVKSAEANGIKLIVALENYWNDYGGIKERLKWEGIEVSGGGVHDQGQFFTNEAAIEGYKNYVKYFLTRVNHYDNVEYRNDPTILAWELMNEPRYQGFGDDLTSNVLRKWVDDMGEFVKSIDSNHLLGTGLEAHGIKYGFGGDEGNDFIKIHQSPNIDFTSAHPYIREEWANFTPEQTKQLICTLADESHDIVKKPFFVGEFNVERDERTEWWETIYDFIEEKKIGGSAFWWFPDEETGEDKFAVFEGDPVLDIFIDHANEMEKMSGGEAIYVSLVNPQSGAKLLEGGSIEIETNLINANNTVASVDFYSNDTLIGSDNTSPFNFKLENLPNGDYEIKAVANGIAGNSTTSQIRKINVGTDAIKLEYKNGSPDLIASEIKPQFQILNLSSQSLAYKDLSIRYWFTAEDNKDFVFERNYVVIGGNNVLGSFTNVDNDLYYLEVSFKESAGILESNGNSKPMELRINTEGFTSQDQSNDYSFIGPQEVFNSNNKIGLYYKGKLISGTEPESGSTTLSVNEFEATVSTLKVYPNPTLPNSILTIQTLNSSITANSIEIIDLTGKVIIQKSIVNSTETTQTINLGNIATGMYLINVKSNDSNHIERIIIE